MLETLRLWRAWLGVPWRETSLALALIGAAAAPAFLLAAADVWEASAADDFTMRLVTELDADEAGVSVASEGFFIGETVSSADELVTERLAEVEGLEPAVRTLATFRAPVTILPDQASGAVPVRVMARPGALDSIDVVAQVADTSDGVWVSRWFSEDRGVDLGDSIDLESAAEPEQPGAETAPGGGPSMQFPVVGIYETLWSPDGTTLPPYWEGAPDGLIPTYITTFREPNFALVLTDEDTLARAGVSGFAQWDAAVEEAPTTLESLRALVASYRDLETDLLSAPDLSDALARLASQPGALASTSSALPDTLADVESGVDSLGQPLAAARIAGVLLGLGVMIASAYFVVEKHRLTYRLHAAEGDRWVAIASRTLAQLVVPVGLGALAGVIAAVFVGSWLGPAVRLSFDQVDVAIVLAVELAGIIFTAIVVGLLAQRTLDRGELKSRSTGVWVVALTALATGFVWFQIGQAGPTGTEALDLGVVLLPILVLITAVSILIVILGWLTNRARFAGQDLPTPAYLAWRRVSSGDTITELIVSALAIGIGLVLFSSTIVGTLERATEVAVASIVGADARVEVVRTPPTGTDLPDDSTLVFLQRTRVLPGDVPLRVLAVDTETFSDVASWPHEYGSDATTVIERLDGEQSHAIPVVAIRGEGIPSSGAFSFGGTPFPFTVAEYVDGLPLAEERVATILVSAERLDRWELERLADVRGAPPDSQEVLDAFEPPTEQFRALILSQGGAEGIQRFVDDQNLVLREVVVRSDITDTVDVIAPLLAFDYLSLLGYVAASSALAALLLYLSARRDRTQLSVLMAGRMGLARSKASAVTVIEVVGLTLVASVAGLLAAPLSADRLLPRFDPTPLLPPQVQVQLSPAAFFGTLAGLVLAVALIVWGIEMYLSGREQGGFLRARD